jgi:hypothetical protein
MKKIMFFPIFLSLVVVCFQTIGTFAQTTDVKLIPVQVNEKWGYIDGKGKIVIEPRFDEAHKFSEGLALVTTKLKAGFIDSTGKFVIEPKYTFAFDFSEGLAAVGISMDDERGYIDRKGNIVIKPAFSWAGPFKDGLAQVLVRREGTANLSVLGYIDKTGKFKIQPRFDSAEAFSEGLAVFTENAKNPEFSSQAYFNKKSFMNEDGNGVTPFFDNAEDFSEGLAAVKVGDKWGFIDTAGNIVIAPQFGFVLREFTEGIAFVECENEKTAAIDKSGKLVTECVFDEAWEFSEGTAAVQMDGKFGFIDRAGKFLIRPQFDSALSFYNGLAEINTVKDGWKYTGFIDKKGKIVFPLTRSTKLD